MEFSVLKKTAKGNLVLSPKPGEEAKGIEKLNLHCEGRKAAVVFDSIGSVEKPLYLAKPLSSERDFAGKKLYSK